MTKFYFCSINFNLFSLIHIILFNLNPCPKLNKEPSSTSTPEVTTPLPKPSTTRLPTPPLRTPELLEVNLSTQLIKPQLTPPTNQVLVAPPLSEETNQFMEDKLPTALVKLTTNSSTKHTPLLEDTQDLDKA